MVWILASAPEVGVSYLRFVVSWKALSWDNLEKTAFLTYLYHFFPVPTITVSGEGSRYKLELGVYDVSEYSWGGIHRTLPPNRLSAS